MHSMQVNLINSYNTNSQTTFKGHGARSFGQVMDRLYDAAYGHLSYNDAPDIIQVSTKLKNGKEISGIANFVKGRFAGLSLPYEFAKLKSEFCKSVMDKYNQAMTKGKAKDKFLY